MCEIGTGILHDKQKNNTSTDETRNVSTDDLKNNDEKTAAPAGEMQPPSQTADFKPATGEMQPPPATAEQKATAEEPPKSAASAEQKTTAEEPPKSAASAGQKTTAEEPPKSAASAEQKTTAEEPPKSAASAEQKTTAEEPPKSAASAEQKESIDQANAAMVDLAQETMQESGNRSHEQESKEDDPFDSFPVDWNEEKDGAREKEYVPVEIRDLKTDIGKLREGNLYKAVTLARTLEQNGSNPKSAGRFSRFLDSSVWDYVADANAVIGNGITMIDTVDTNEKSKSVWEIATLISNLITFCTTCRNLVQKTRKLFDKGTGTFDRLIQLVGAIGDIATLLSKAVSITKTIISLAGSNDKIIKQINNYMWIANGTAQIAGIISGSSVLYKKAAGIKTVNEDEKKLEKDVQKILIQNGKEQSVNQNGLAEAAEKLLSENPANLKDNERDKLILYLGLTRRKSRMIQDLAVAAAGIFTNVIGLASSGVTGADNIVNGDGDKNETLSDAATGMKLATNGVVMVNSSIKIVDRITKKKGPGEELVKNNLWEKIVKLKDEKYGLKKLEESMLLLPENATEEDKKAVESSDLTFVKEPAEEAKTLYENVESQFRMLGVPYGQLLKSGSIDAFKNSLIAGL